VVGVVMDGQPHVTDPRPHLVLEQLIHRGGEEYPRQVEICKPHGTLVSVGRVGEHNRQRRPSVGSKDLDNHERHVIVRERASRMLHELLQHG